MNYNLSDLSQIPLLSKKDSLKISESLELPPILNEEIPQASNLTSSSNDTSPIPPAFLEPTLSTEHHHLDTKLPPKFPNIRKESIQISLPTLVPSSSSSCSSVSSNSPSPIMRNGSLHSDNNTFSIINSDPNTLYIPILRYTGGTNPLSLVPIQSKNIYQNDSRYTHTTTLWNIQNDYAITDEVRSPPSPIMLAASNAAAVESIKSSPSSEVFLNNFDQKALKPIIPDHSVTKESPYRLGREVVNQHDYSAMHFRPQDPKPFLISPNQSMFLTKNAHVKRPRNAWIRFRCHYGQALKLQDPTLRAEEISKRASRRWSNLSEKEKKPWHDLAEQEKQAHKEAFPNYRYCPRRASTTAIFAGDINQPSIKTIPLYSKFGLDDGEESMNKNKRRRP